MALQLPRDWRLRRERYQLVGGRCPECGRLHFPNRPVCRQCGKEGPEPYRFDGKGEVYSHATMYKAPIGFEQDIPYVVALVRLEEGPLVTAQITDIEPSEVSIGMPVEVVVRQWRQHGKDGPIVYGYKFRPLLDAEAAGGVSRAP
jgi:hypothetical protein